MNDTTDETMDDSDLEGVPETIDTVKAITICQPYAHLIATGKKRVENRTWSTDYRGPILIHAGKSEDYLNIIEGADAVYNIPLADMAFGAIVATAEIVDCLEILDIQAGKHDEKYPWIKEHEHTEGPYCFVLDNVVPITPVPYRGAQGIFNVPSDVLPTEPITDNSDGLDDKLTDEQVTDGLLAGMTDAPKIITPDPDAEVRMLREHDQHLRELAEEHQDLEREWEASKLQTKKAKDELDECALRLRNAALARPTFGPLFDSAKEPSPVAPIPAPVEAAEQPPAEEPVVSWRETTIDGNAPEGVARAALGLDLITFGEVADLLAINSDDDVIFDLVNETGVAREQAVEFINRINALVKADEPNAEAPADPDYWKPVSIDELNIPASLKTKLHDHDINTLEDLSLAVIACGHEGYRGLEGVGPKKAEQLEDAWQQWFAKHPAPQIDPVEEPAEVAA